MHILDSSLGESIRLRIEEHARQFVDRAPCGYLVTDDAGRLLLTNDVLLNWLGYTAQEFPKDYSLTDLLNKGNQIYYETQFAPLLHLQGEVSEISVDLARKDGSALPVLLSAFRHPEDDPSIQSIVVVNFSDRKRYERELMKARQNAEASDQAKSMFLSTISHEVLTPLNAIIGTADLLSITKLDAHQQRLQGILLHSGNHLLSLFRNLLVVAKTGLGELEVTPNPFFPRRMVEAIVDSFRYGGPDGDVTYFSLIEEAVPRVVEGDESLISQVLTNLIGNATKFSRGGRVEVTVQVLERQDSEYALRFTVEDDGIGISEENRANLFEPFTQGTTDTHQEFGGSGLGLSICQRILQAMDSEVQLESTLGKGSRFWFDLTLPESEAPEDDTVTVGELPEIGMGRVLIVEDNRTNAFLVARYFRRWKVSFDLAGDGQEALDRVKARDYDLVLMDLKMPIMDGYTAAKKIRELPSPKADVPIIAFSASARMAMTERMRDAHIDEFTLKPFDPRKLHAVVLRFLAPSPMNFTELRDAMDHDAEDLASFSSILRRELEVAADELETAFEQRDVQRIADLKHKLKTSLQLLEADTVKQDLQQTVDDLRADRPIDEGIGTVIIEELRQLSRRLARERW